MTQQAQDVIENVVVKQIIENIFLPPAAGENVTDYFTRLGIDSAPPKEYLEVLQHVRRADVQLSQVNIWNIAMRFAALLFAQRDTLPAQAVIKDIAKHMPQFPLEPLFDQAPTEYAREVLHPESAEQKAFSKIDQVIDQRLKDVPVPNATTGGPASRYKQILHIECGTEFWEPTTLDLQNIVAQFQAAALDENGGIVATRKGVTTHFIETNISPVGVIASLKHKQDGELHAELGIVAGTVFVPEEPPQAPKTDSAKE